MHLVCHFFFTSVLYGVMSLSSLQSAKYCMLLPYTLIISGSDCYTHNYKVFIRRVPLFFVNYNYKTEKTVKKRIIRLELILVNRDERRYKYNIYLWQRKNSRGFMLSSLQGVVARMIYPTHGTKAVCVWPGEGISRPFYFY